MLELAGLLIVLWLLGVVIHIGGGFIHILIIVAVVLFIFNQLDRRKL